MESPTFDKQLTFHVEYGDGDEVKLEPAHEAYLLERHGTTDLNPLPSADPKDPLNWPNWKKNFMIALISYHVGTCTFVAGGLSPAYESFAEEYGVSMTQASYTTSCQMIVQGFFPFIFVPLMNTYGRNKFLSVSALFSFALHIGGAYCKTYGQQIATRVLVAFVNTTAIATGSSIVHDLTFAKDRGSKNGIWSVSLVVGTVLGPFITGFIVQHTGGFKWIFYMFAIMSFTQALLWAIVDETVYFPFESSSYKWTFPKRNFDYSLWYRPFRQFKNFNATVAGIAIALAFCYANIAFSVELPGIMVGKFGLDSQQLSLQYIALIIGSIIGEILAGPLSDWWMSFCIRRRKGKKVIVDRLWLSYDGIILCIVGWIIFGVYLTKAKQNQWIITPLIGCAIGAAGQNIMSTVSTAFAIDSDPVHASDVGMYINMWRLVYGFTGPFYLPDMFDSIGFSRSAGVLSGLIAFGGVCLMMAHWRYRNKVSTVTEFL